MSFFSTHLVVVQKLFKRNVFHSWLHKSAVVLIVSCVSPLPSFSCSSASPSRQPLRNFLAFLTQTLFCFCSNVESSRDLTATAFYCCVRTSPFVCFHQLFHMGLHLNEPFYQWNLLCYSSKGKCENRSAFNFTEDCNFNNGNLLCNFSVSFERNFSLRKSTIQTKHLHTLDPKNNFASIASLFHHCQKGKSDFLLCKLALKSELIHVRSSFTPSGLSDTLRGRKLVPTTLPSGSETKAGGVGVCTRKIRFLRGEIS